MGQTDKKWKKGNIGTKGEQWDKQTKSDFQRCPWLRWASKNNVGLGFRRAPSGGEILN